jgi:hypothetical protein
MKIPVMLSAERFSVVKNDPGRRLIPRSRIFEVSQKRGPVTIGKDHALKDRVRP